MKINAILITLLGVLLVLPLVGVDQIGTPTEGIMGWVIALVVLAIGVMQLMNKE